MDEVTRFRLFRSRAFWLGMPGLVFLLWLWSQSVPRGFIATWTGGPGSFKFSNEQGAILVTRSPRGSDINFGTEFWKDGWPAKEDPKAEWWPQPEASRHADGMRYWTLPYWLLGAVYLIPWSGLVIWRWRKFGRVPLAG
jgi:hypothetical protein